MRATSCTGTASVRRLRLVLRRPAWPMRHYPPSGSPRRPRPQRRAGAAVPASPCDGSDGSDGSDGEPRRHHPSFFPSLMSLAVPRPPVRCLRHRRLTDGTGLRPGNTDRRSTHPGLPPRQLDLLGWPVKSPPVDADGMLAAARPPHRSRRCAVPGQVSRLSRTRACAARARTSARSLVTFGFPNPNPRTADHVQGFAVLADRDTRRSPGKGRSGPPPQKQRPRRGAARQRSTLNCTSSAAPWKQRRSGNPHDAAPAHALR